MPDEETNPGEAEVDEELEDLAPEEGEATEVKGGGRLALTG